MNKRMVLIIICAVLAAGVAYLALGKSKQAKMEMKAVKPFFGEVEKTITTTATVKPQNRLEIMPPISGRIDKILVQEGQAVKTGDILALMSSTDRAALLDAAKLQGEEKLKSWEDVYKPTPLIAPIDGEVIVKSVNPGQTVTQTDAVVVLSDRLIVQAQVDETDIGKVKLGQAAKIILDAYPDIEVKAKVDHIYYESETVNNVTIYKVDIVPDNIPDVFRSGMNANVTIVQMSKQGCLLLPADAVKNENGKSFVFVNRGGQPTRVEVVLGIADENNVEILSGLAPEDEILEQVARYDVSKSSKSKMGSNPFMPKPPGMGKKSR